MSADDSPRTVYLVDASPYVFRAFFSLPSSMVSPDGQPVAAVYGFASFLVKLVDEEQPSHLGVAFDESLTTSFRNEIYPQYKAQRELPPPELEAQLAACKEMAEALGAAVYCDDRYEADDLIGTLAAQLTAGGDGVRVTVVTSDKDLAQLVGDSVSLYDFARGERYDTAGVREKLGVAPQQVAELLALAGDPVDNIPGVAGIGRKTAVVLLEHFPTVEAIYQRLDEVEELPIRGARSVRRKLEDGRRQAEISRRLALIARDAPVKAQLAELELAGADSRRLDPLLQRLGFGDGLRQRVPRWRDGT
jgi:5'-3' exonuclease